MPLLLSLIHMLPSIINSLKRLRNLELLSMIRFLRMGIMVSNSDSLIQIFSHLSQLHTLGQDSVVIAQVHWEVLLNRFMISEWVSSPPILLQWLLVVNHSEPLAKVISKTQLGRKFLTQSLLMALDSKKKSYMDHICPIQLLMTTATP